MENYKITSQDRIRGTYEYAYEHQGIVYFLETAWKRVVDDYDEYLGSVELDHYELLGYNIAFGYEPSSVTKLDFSWMKREDVISVLSCNLDSTVQKIILNSGNLSHSYFGLSRNVYIEIINNSNFTYMAKGLRRFIKKHGDNIVSITFKNVTNPIVKAWITSTCNSANIPVAFEEAKKNDKIYTHKQKKN